MKVVLLGYMASGKSTVGRLLAQSLGFNFIDLDQAIEKIEGVSIPQLFLEKGEIYFRKKETELLEQILDKNPNIILSLGGGTPCYGQNMQLIDQRTDNSFYLKLSIPTLVSRIKEEKSIRPLVADIADKDLPEFIGKHLFERAPFYTLAKHCIEGDGKMPEEIALEIQNILI